MPINPDLISLYAAHGIDMRVTETWSPAVYREPRALVPCELNVLMVRNPQQQWADCKMRDLPQAVPGVTTAPIPAEDFMPDPFDTLAQPRDRGAYLHWYLPNALTSGEAGSDLHQAKFPQVPDRTAVMRISTDASSQRRKVRGWVLNCGVNPRTVTDLNLWTETGNPDPALAGQPLTALGTGDPSWAGYYDNVENVLGFHDQWLDSDAVVGPISYVVCGWYADPAADPLGDASIRSSAQFYALLQRLGWHIDEAELDTARHDAQQYAHVTNALQLPSYSYVDGRFDRHVKETPWWPRSVLLHAAVVGIGWPNDAGGQEESGGPPSASSIKVAVGNTMAEAIGTLVARVNAKPDEAQIIEALQLGAIRDLEQADGRAKLDLALHASSFASYSGGAPSVEPLTIPPSGPPPGAPSDPPVPGPGVFTTPPPPPPPHFSGFRSPLSAQRNLDLFAGAASMQRDLPKIEVAGGLPHSARAEEMVLQGNIASVIDRLGLGRVSPVFDPGGTVNSNRAAPRLYTPKDPVLLVQGAKRAFVHDSSVHTEDGVLNCRLGSVTSLSWRANGRQYSTNPGDILAGGIHNGSVPPECQTILHETLLLDPGSAQVAVTAAVNRSATASGGNAARESFDSEAAHSSITVEQTVWWALRDPRVDHRNLLAQSGITGTLPAAFSVSPPSRPWTPIHLDWQVEYVPSPNGVADWTLDEIDYDHSAPLPASGGGKIFSGRAMLTSGASSSLAAAVRNAQKQAASIGGGGTVPAGATHEAYYSALARSLTESFASLSLGGAVEASDLADIVSELDQIDILSCGLDGLLKQLRAGLAPGKIPLNTATPEGFVALRAGALYFKRLRLVDGFGQFLDICESSATTPASGLIVSDAVSIGRSDAIGLPPRFTAPARLWFRYMRADSTGDASQDQEADYQTSPVCGYVMPNHLDGALEFFNADGSGAGTLLSDDDGLVRWEDTPGRVTAAGQDPAQALSNPFTAGIANGLIDWGVADSGRNDEAALRAFLRTIDTTLWTVDPFAGVGEEHLALLIGHPIIVARAKLRLEVADPIASEDATVTAVPVELGHLAHWQDGLLGYFVNDDYTRLYAATASAAMARPCGPRQGFLEQINLVPQHYADFAADIDPTAGTGAHAVVHPYVDTRGRIFVRPNQTVMLTLLVEPHTSVHATTGLVPRKAIDMNNDWVSGGLAKIAPTFRFGPVLVDPQRIKMPLAADIQGNWTWDYRADSVKWREGPVTNATDAALLAPDPPTAMEGWLRLDPLPAEGE